MRDMMVKWISNLEQEISDIDAQMDSCDAESQKKDLLTQKNTLEYKLRIVREMLDDYDKGKL